MTDAPTPRPRSRSRDLFEQAKQVMPGGVNSPVRSFGAVGGVPPFMTYGAGSRLWDVDGDEYIDYVGSWGPLIFGHGLQDVIEVISRAAERGTTFGAPTELEVELGRVVIDAFPSIDLVRFVNSGTEATMSALRVARAYTNRSMVLKFAGCYHGHVDSLLVKAGSGVATFGLPGTAGVPESMTRDTLVAPYADMTALEQVFAEFGDRLACAIIEPIAANMGVVPTPPGYLEAVRDLCRKHGALFILDEVVTGFRVAFGGAQEYYDLKADLTCLGKVLGGGMPVGAYGGRRDIMERVAPLGDVYQAGTLSGNPLAMAAGLVTLRALQNRRDLYTKLDEAGEYLCDHIARAAYRTERTVRINRVGSMFTVFFHDRNVRDYDMAMAADAQAYGRFFHGLLDRGVYFPPSQMEAAFVSLAHSVEDLDATVEAAEAAFAAI